ncbi:hypothetical protein EC844_12523 [Acinetobacter calcoaceticus]|uniref:NlpC/P60 domain-containing protein n=1 Tax=Acinetobacter calcoaceticus TaxID=471 RepID=A0A4R1XKR3_ACICA|nr:hypothetical protein EC844_12523 [Acinetobacter calcoaceticus]
MIEQFLDREPKQGYVCNEFVIEAWQAVTGEDLKQRLEDHLNGNTSFEQLSEPISPCLVLFSNSARSPTHIGLFYDCKVLHLAASGAQYVPLEMILGFKNREFYR